MNFNFFSKKTAPLKSSTPSVQIPRSELREFLMNNRLQGELLIRVNALKEQDPELSNYEAVELVLDSIASH